MYLSLLLGAPAFWGALGAFIYAAPKLISCFVASAEAGTGSGRCWLEFVFAIATGAIAAAAFSSVASELIKIKDGNAVAAMVGLLANPTAPVLVKRVSSLVGTALASKVEERLPGDGK